MAPAPTSDSGGLAGWWRYKRSRSPEGIRITKVGLWYVLFTLLGAIAATNTGNNSLYMVVAVMLAALVVSGVVSRHNVDGLSVAVETPDEIFAHQPFSLAFHIVNRSRLLPHWFLLVAPPGDGGPRLIPHLPRGGASRGRLEVMLPRRGRHRLRALHVASLFPFGFFRKGVRYRLDEEVLVYPEIFPSPSLDQETGSRFGDQPSRHAGWGHDLHALRDFRHGDDPRGIHWKQSARTGDLVYLEREAEQGRRVAILFDNGVLDDDRETLSEAEDERFERLVSEAATLGVDRLARGWEVELVTRDGALPFATGLRQRVALLETLALVEPTRRSPRPLRSTRPGAPGVYLGAGPRDEADRLQGAAAASEGRPARRAARSARAQRPSAGGEGRSA